MLENLNSCIGVLFQIILILILCVIVTILICAIIYIIGLFKYVMEQEVEDEEDSKTNH